MATLPELLARLAGLQEIKASGIDTVQIGDKRTQFRSMADLDRAINDLENEIAAARGQRRRSRFLKTYASKGL